MDAAIEYQRALLEYARSISPEAPLSAATETAYLATPRHRFVRRYREWGSRAWQEVSAANMEAHVGTLYANRSLILAGEDDAQVESTISQPLFVLRMLDLLQLRPGQTVFELGTGSGWNAALLAHVVGPTGCIYSLELLSDLAQQARDTLEDLGISNVHVIAADGGEGYVGGAPYDRAIFTGGAYDLPRPFYAQVKEGGLLLFVLKHEGEGDLLFLLRKREDHFESLESRPCDFIPLRGKYQRNPWEPLAVERLPEWPALQGQVMGTTPFWWGGKGRRDFERRTRGIRSFLSITEPGFRVFEPEKADARVLADPYFGLWEPEQHSLVLVKDDRLLAYGSAVAQDRLLQRVHRWVDLGMPSAASFALRVYPSDAPVRPAEREWVVKRNESQFLWRVDL